MTLRLHVRVCEARGLKSTQTFGTQDPYVQVSSTDGFRAKTATHTDGGRSAEWNQKFELDLSSTAVRLQFDVKNDNMTSDALIGSLVLEVSSLATGALVDSWYRISQRSGTIPSGELRLRMQLDPAYGPLYARSEHPHLHFLILDV